MAYSQKNKRGSTTSPEQAAVESVLGVLWSLFKAIFSLFKPAGGGRTSVRQKELRALAEHWEQVEMYALQEASWSLAVSEGDKTVDAALRALGLPGATMGERLRAAETRLPAALYQDLWNAHKLRNALAHEVGATASGGQVRAAVSAFRQTLYHLKVLS